MAFFKVVLIFCRKRNILHDSDTHFYSLQGDLILLLREQKAGRVNVFLTQSL